MRLGCIKLVNVCVVWYLCAAGTGGIGGTTAGVADDAGATGAAGVVGAICMFCGDSCDSGDSGGGFFVFLSNEYCSVLGPCVPVVILLLELPCFIE